MTPRKPDHALTLDDRLSQLTFEEACKLLGARGGALIRRGGAVEVDVLPRIAVDAERVALAVCVPPAGTATVTFSPCARVVVASFELEPLGGENSTTT